MLSILSLLVILIVCYHVIQSFTLQVSSSAEKYIYNNFINEFKNLEKWEEILLIPLGKAVEEVLIKLKEDGIVKEEQVLMGFPHPSGANVNRVAQFEANRDNMIKFIKKHFI